MGEMSQILARTFPHPQGSHKGSEEGRQSTPDGCNNFFNIFGKKGDTWRLILGYNHAGHCFVLRDLVLIELLQVSHNYVTE